MQKFSFLMYLRQNVDTIIAQVLRWVVMVFGLWLAGITELIFIAASVIVWDILFQYGQAQAQNTEEPRALTLRQFFNEELTGVSLAVVLTGVFLSIFCALGKFPWAVLQGFAVVVLGLLCYYHGRFLGINKGWTSALFAKIAVFLHLSAHEKTESPK